MQRLEHSYGVQETARKPLFIKHTAPAAAKLHQSCPTLCDPIDSSPPGSPVPGIPGRNTGVGCHFLHQCMKVESESEVERCVRLLATPWTAAYQAPSSMGFSREEYWSGVPCLLHKHADQEAKWWEAIRDMMVAVLTGLYRLLKDFGWHFEWGEKALKGFDREVI